MCIYKENIHSPTRVYVLLCFLLVVSTQPKTMNGIYKAILVPSENWILKLCRFRSIFTNSTCLQLVKDDISLYFWALQLNKTEHKVTEAGKVLDSSLSPTIPKLLRKFD